jgi:hypothetical protein
VRVPSCTPGLLILVALLSAPAAAQPAGPEAPPPVAGVEFLSRFAFHLSAEHLSSDDERYVWDANYGGEIDLVDYGAGRATFYANYQTILGEQLRAFDPNQGNYILGGRVSARVRGVEAALGFHHESRHLSDRPKQASIDWNMIGGRVVRAFDLGAGSFEGRADLRGVIRKSSVDYTWEIDAGLRARYPLASRLAVVGDVDVRRLWIDGSRHRSAQHGIRGEAGIRLEGRGAAVELFVAGERRIDPYPLTFGVEHWFSAGFRLVNRP